MDESWRMRMGVSSSSAGSSALEPEDFDDVFGGPPRSVLARKHSVDFSGNDWFYNEIFKQPELETRDFVSGRKLPEFVIPERRSRRPKIKHAKSKSMSLSISKSKSSCSSVLSFDEINELNNFRSATVIPDEDIALDLASYTCKLRPINVPSKWTSSSTSAMPKTNLKNQELHTFVDTNNSSYRENNKLVDDYMITSFEFGYPQTMPSPDIMQLSPSSPFSSLCHGFDRNNFNYQENNTYVCRDLNFQVNNNCQAIDIDEAIAWAKEKFQGWNSSNAEACNNNTKK